MNLNIYKTLLETHNATLTFDGRQGYDLAYTLIFPTVVDMGTMETEWFSALESKRFSGSSLIGSKFTILEPSPKDVYFRMYAIMCHYYPSLFSIKQTRNKSIEYKLDSTYSILDLGTFIQNNIYHGYSFRRAIRCFLRDGEVLRSECEVETHRSKYTNFWSHEISLVLIRNQPQIESSLDPNVSNLSSDFFTGEISKIDQFIDQCINEDIKNKTFYQLVGKDTSANTNSLYGRIQKNYADIFKTCIKSDQTPKEYLKADIYFNSGYSSVSNVIRTTQEFVSMLNYNQNIKYYVFDLPTSKFDITHKQLKSLHREDCFCLFKPVQDLENTVTGLQYLGYPVNKISEHIKPAPVKGYMLERGLSPANTFSKRTAGLLASVSSDFKYYYVILPKELGQCFTLSSLLPNGREVLDFYQWYTGQDDYTNCKIVLIPDDNVKKIPEDWKPYTKLEDEILKKKSEETGTTLQAGLNQMFLQQKLSNDINIFRNSYRSFDLIDNNIKDPNNRLYTKWIRPHIYTSWSNVRYVNTSSYSLENLAQCKGLDQNQKSFSLINMVKNFYNVKDNALPEVMVANFINDKLKLSK